MKLYQTQRGPALEINNNWYDLADLDFGSMTVREDLSDFLLEQIKQREKIAPVEESALLAPMANQEVWAAGVTYFRSRTARMEEAENAGGGTFYDRVYQAERPELFFKATPHRVVGPGGAVFIRGDSKWNVPEPELTILLSPSGQIVGYTVGNDMSSRDIEGENPLYLPQAKVYQNSCALGPCLYVCDQPLPIETNIYLQITRGEATIFKDETSLKALKREPRALIDYLFRFNQFPSGCFLMTGTGIVPPDSFTLQTGDSVAITIDRIGTLTNTVEQAK